MAPSKLDEETRKQRRKESQARYREKNRELLKQKGKEYREKNKEQIKERNKDRKKFYDKKFYDKNKEKLKERSKDYYEKNKEEIRKKQNNYQKNKRKNDIIFKIRSNLRGRLRLCINSYVKKETTNILISCNPDFFIKWIEYQFNTYMSWDNYGKYWQLDHVKPLSLFNLKNKNERIIAMHWSNIRPLESKKNNSKNNKFSFKITYLHEIVIKSFELKIKNENWISSNSKWTIRSEDASNYRAF